MQMKKLTLLVALLLGFTLSAQTIIFERVIHTQVYDTYKVDSDPIFRTTYIDVSLDNKFIRFEDVSGSFTFEIIQSTYTTTWREDLGEVNLVEVREIKNGGRFVLSFTETFFALLDPENKTILTFY